MNTQFAFTGFPTGAFKRSLARLYAWMAAPTIAPVTDTLTTGVGTNNATLAAYVTDITTGGTGAANPITMPSGQYIGQEKVIRLANRVHASDTTTFVMANIEEGLITTMVPGAATALTLDTNGEFVLLKWFGAKWCIMFHTGVLTT